MKKFLIIGNANAITYKEIFPHIAGGEVFIRTKDGVTNFAMHFKTPDGEKTASALWYTNLDSRHLYKELNLTKEYSPEEYPKYGNYDAIEVGCIKDIPYDYDGVMGVPITVLLYDLEGYEIVGCPDANVLPDGWRGMTKEFVDLYYAQGNTGQYQEGQHRFAYYVTNEGMAKVPYKRILIRRKLKK